MSSLPSSKGRRPKRPAAERTRVLRPLTPADLQLEVDFLLGLSSESLYQRVMGTVRMRSVERVMELLTYEPGPSMVLGAVEGEGRRRTGSPRLLGVARYAPSETAGVAEMAIIVADDQHRRGVARALLERLHEIALENGYREMMALTFANNLPMLGLARRLGYQRVVEAGDGGVVRLRKRLIGGGAGEFEPDDQDSVQGGATRSESNRRTAIETPRISRAMPAPVAGPGQWPRSR